MQSTRSKLTVKVGGPLDNFEGTFLLEEWLDMNPNGRIRCMELFIRAVTAVTRHPWWDGELRCEPRIAYNPDGVLPYFIFKLDNNGTTYFVGEEVPDFEDGEGETGEVEVI